MKFELPDIIAIGPALPLRVEDGLDDAVFNHPLTIKLDLPEDWIGTHIELRAATTVLDSLYSDDQRLYFDTLPDNRLYRLVKLDVAN